MEKNMVYILIYLLIGGFITNLCWIERHRVKNTRFMDKRFTKWEYSKGLIIGYLGWVIVITVIFYDTYINKD